MANLLVTYLLWMFGGAFGLHHLYLGRPYHAFVWYCTLGGVFGIGWLRELWRIPEYVRSSNGGKDFQMEQLSRIGRRPRPYSGIPRLIGMWVMGFLLSSGLCGMLPNYELDGPGYLFYRCCSICMVLIGSSLGVYIVANVGVIQCSPKYPVSGALLSLPWLAYSPANITMASLLAMLVTWWAGIRWKPLHPLAKNRGVKLGKFVLLATLWTSVLCYGFYYNATVSVDGEERIPLRTVLGNFFSSPAWRHTKESVYQMWEAFWERGWDHMFEDVSDIFDFSGEVAAFQVIGLSTNATQPEITKKCRMLSAKSHPDKFKTDSEKEEAQARFIEVQEACNTLSKSKSKSQGRRRHDKDS